MSTVKDYLPIVYPVQAVQVELSDEFYRRLELWAKQRNTRLYFVLGPVAGSFIPWLQNLDTQRCLEVREGHFLVGDKSGVISYTPEAFDAHYVENTSQHQVRLQV